MYFEVLLTDLKIQDLNLIKLYPRLGSRASAVIKPEIKTRLNALNYFEKRDCNNWVRFRLPIAWLPSPKYISS